MATPIIGAQNRLDDQLLILVPAEDTSFPKENLFDDREFTVYKPTSSATTVDIITDAGVGNTITVDYLGVVSHDLSDPASDGSGNVAWTFQDSADNAAYNAITSGTQTKDRIILRTFSSVTNRFFRFRMTRGSAFIPSIGQLHWGLKVTMPFGITVGFDPQDEQIRGRTNRSQQGNLLGSITTFSSRRARVNIPLLTNTFIRDNTTGSGFNFFWENFGRKLLPFIFSWNPGDPGLFEEDAFFAVIDSKAGIRRPLRSQLDIGFHDLTFTVVGLQEE